MNGTSKIKLDYPIRTGWTQSYWNIWNVTDLPQIQKIRIPGQMMYTLNYEIRLRLTLSLPTLRLLQTGIKGGWEGGIHYIFQTFRIITHVD